MRICVIADTFAPPYDEGFRKISFRLAKELAREHEVLALSQDRADTPFRHDTFRSNQLFISMDLRRKLREFEPDVTFYVPFSSFTRNSFFRARNLKRYRPEGALALLGVQARKWTDLDLGLMLAWQPDIVLTPVPEAIDQLREFRIRAAFLAFGVDLKKFRPLYAPNARSKLKEKYGLDPADRVYLHVGQITRKRNVAILRQLQMKGSQVVVVGSSSSSTQGFPHDQDVVRELEKAGAKVWIRYFDKVSELYQLADCYLFPTFHETGGIGFPLSVLEALACGTRVVSTAFGGLPFQLPDCEAMRYAKNDDELISLARSTPPGGTPTGPFLVKSLGWDSVADTALELTLRSAGVNPYLSID